ncbi:metallophosphoesterase [Aporhodopirellula aestuarii]|uniref:Metallophosphoesterase n=1 Tax=Aporhodopirellula aestuarii TaxID=2950107 RepID=A0ABT0U7Y3_9BACT|nr:metallophosphoesterase [Aporhodopirellula aestuarii]MCM2373027.1 metallophosphoesterase [Aporhodopirellula aestuarii]
MANVRISHDSTPPNIATLVPAGSMDAGHELTTAFISDLHLLSSRCNYSHHSGAVRNAIEAADVCVWGGDLFDFCWSCEGDGPTSRQIALDWLESWREEFPEKRFVYLTGNHDAQPEFQRILAEWARPHRPAKDTDMQDHELALHDGAVYVGLDAIRIGDCLMVHGDVIEGGGSIDGLGRYRSRWHHERTGIHQPPAIRNHLYNAAVTARLHLATAGMAHRRKNVCMRLLHWIRCQPDWLGHGVRRIVFGHTHRRLGGVRIAGYEFYNTGAAVRHVPFEPVVLDLSL